MDKWKLQGKFYENDLFDVEELERQNKPVKVVYVCKEEEDELLKYAEELTEEKKVHKNKSFLQVELSEAFKEAETINQKLKLDEHKRLNMEARKTMVLPYFDNPKNDNELLLNYQYDYIRNNDNSAWGKLLLLAFDVTKRLVWKWMKTQGDKLDDIAQDEKTSIAVEYVLRRYEKNIGWYVSTNYITALSEGVKHAMLYKTKKDQEVEYLEDRKEK